MQDSQNFSLANTAHNLSFFKIQNVKQRHEYLHFFQYTYMWPVQFEIRQPQTVGTRAGYIFTLSKSPQKVC